jgi:hypothetical protein
MVVVGGDRMFQAPPDAEEGYRQKLRGCMPLLAGRRGLLPEAIAEAGELDRKVRAFRKASTSPP